MVSITYPINPKVFPRTRMVSKTPSFRLTSVIDISRTFLRPRLLHRKLNRHRARWVLVSGERNLPASLEEFFSFENGICIKLEHEATGRAGDDHDHARGTALF